MRRSTVIFVLLFLIAAGAYILLTERTKTGAEESAPATSEPIKETSFLFDATDGVPTSIHIESKTGDVVEVVRNAENIWALVLPLEASADQGAVDAAASQVTTMRIQEKIPNLDPDILGLTSPEYVLKIKFTSNAERKADVGVLTPSEGGYYVRNEAGEILIVDRDSVDALLGLLANPPYSMTETPAPPQP